MAGESGQQEVLELGPSGRLRAVLRMVGGVGLAVAILFALLLLFGPERDPLPLVLLPVQGLLALAPYIGVSLRTTVKVDQSRITIAGGPRLARGSWAWSQILEVCMLRQGGWTIAVRPRGSTWDVPGPQAPAVVQVPFRSRDAVQEARSLLSTLCQRHGAMFTESAEGLGSAPPGSRLRGGRG